MRNLFFLVESELVIGRSEMLIVIVFNFTACFDSRNNIIS